MKKILFYTFLLSCMYTQAQKATLNESSVTYLDKTFRIGDIIQLGYGSGNNKDFVFVNFGKQVGNLNLPGLYKKADVNWSKAEVEIVKLYTTNGVIWARCNPLNREANYLNKQIFINIEGAVDNKEIKTVSTNKQQTNMVTPKQKNDEPAQPNTDRDDDGTNEKQKATGQKKILDNVPAVKKQNIQASSNTGKSTSKGKLYFRTMMWTSQYGMSLELKWIFLGDDGTMVINPKNGVNPIDYPAELKNNADNVYTYKIAGNKLHITGQNGKMSTWGLEYRNSEISAMDAGIVTRPKAMPANYKLSGQYAASAVFPNVSSVHTLVFNNDGTFSLNKQGAISTRDVSALSKTASKGTYRISGNTLWLNFDNGHTEISTIYIWEQGGGKRHLVIDQSSFPQED